MNGYDKLIGSPTLIRRLIKYHFDFRIYYDDYSDKMVLNIILGNTEYIIALDDLGSITHLWNEIETYWLADRK
jgi:hypothetical protein